MHPISISKHILRLRPRPALPSKLPSFNCIPTRYPKLTLAPSFRHMQPRNRGKEPLIEETGLRGYGLDRVAGTGAPCSDYIVFSSCEDEVLRGVEGYRLFIGLECRYEN